LQKNPAQGGALLAQRPNLPTSGAPAPGAEVIKLFPDGFTALLAAAAILPALLPRPAPVVEPMLLLCADAALVNASPANNPNAISLMIVILWISTKPFGFTQEISGRTSNCSPAHEDAQITAFPRILTRAASA
jgi:hypothetical protein